VAVGRRWRRRCSAELTQTRDELGDAGHAAAVELGDGISRRRAAFDTRDAPLAAGVAVDPAARLEVGELAADGPSPTAARSTFACQNRIR
jgi:hypothetical protein